MELIKNTEILKIWFVDKITCNDEFDEWEEVTYKIRIEIKDLILEAYMIDASDKQCNEIQWSKILTPLTKDELKGKLKTLSRNTEIKEFMDETLMTPEYFWKGLIN